MTRLLILYLSFLSFINARGQNQQIKKLNFKNNSAQKSTLKIDTSKIAIFNLKNDSRLIEKLDGAKPFNLTNTDLKKIDEVLKKCISQNNIDTSYFHYKYQYVPFIDKNGQKKVWINCFCAEKDDNEFINWKKICCYC